MNAFRRIFMLWLLFFLVGHTLPSLADTPDVYLSNRNIGTAVSPKGNGYYLPLELLRRALKANIAVNEETGKIQVNSAPLGKPAVRTPGGWLVPVQEVARALGYEYRHSRGSGMIDLYKPYKKPAPAASNPPADQERSRYINKGMEGQSIDIQQHLVAGKINIFNFYSDY